MKKCALYTRVSTSMQAEIEFRRVEDSAPPRRLDAARGSYRRRGRVWATLRSATRRRDGCRRSHEVAPALYLKRGGSLRILAQLQKIGEWRIRTSEPFRVIRFRGGRNRPLCQLSQTGSGILWWDVGRGT